MSDWREARGRGGPSRHLAAMMSGGAALLWNAGTVAQVAMTLNGPPVQVQPYAPEPGVPLVTVNPGTPNPFAGGSDPSASGGGSDGSGGTGLPGDGSSTGGSVGGGTGGLATMLAQSWGSTAVSEAQALGVNPTTLAAMCTMESQCQNIPNGSGGSATGPFQMLPSTFQAMYQAAVQADPSLAQTTTGDINDPASQAAAAAEYMQQIATQLQNAGVATPTMTDVRAGYGFGQKYAVQVSTAPDSQTLGSILTTWSSSTWAANGLSPSTTVGQWRASIAASVGSAATAPVLGS